MIGKRTISAALLGASLFASGCARGDDGVSFVVQACILAGQAEVRKATGDSGLVSKGEMDTKSEGSVCTYRDPKSPLLKVWRFADEPVVSDKSLAKFKTRLKEDGYVAIEPTKEQAKIAKSDRTFVLAAKGNPEIVRGVMTTYQDITIVVYCPPDAAFKRVVALQTLVRQGYDAQAAAAVGGQ